MLSDIKYHSPKSIEEATKLLSELDDSCVMAGGTDLLVDIKQSEKAPQHIISLQRIKELKQIKRTGDTIHIGALVTPQEIIADPLIDQYFPVLSQAARSMASSQIRSMATIGGNIASAVPSADLPPALIAAEALVHLKCVESEREVLLLEFFSGPRISICRDEEIVTSIRIPFLPPHSGMSYQKFGLRDGNALAVVSAAALIILEKGKIQKAAVVLGAVAPVPVLAFKASDFLQGKKPSQSIFEEAGRIAKEEASPITDIRGSIWHRKELIQTLTQRTLSEALERAEGNL
jgi:carbon-monoxide dehydrogenase medium subunit